MSQDALGQQVALQLKYIQNQRQQIEDLRGRVQRLESLLEFTIADPLLKWLLANRSERMDPTVPLFDPGRAAFHWDRYVFACQHVAGLRVADIACGTGYGSQLLAEQGQAVSVRGVDICPEAIAYARQKHAPAGRDVDFFCASGDATGLDPESVDAIVSFETIEHVDDEQGLLGEFARILRPGGMLICSTPNLWPLAIAPHHVREYDRESFGLALSPYFDSIEMFNQNSGTSFEFNREQVRGIIPTTDDNHALAECFLAVCRKPTAGPA